MCLKIRQSNRCMLFSVFRNSVKSLPEGLSHLPTQRGSWSDHMIIPPYPVSYDCNVATLIVFRLSWLKSSFIVSFEVGLASEFRLFLVQGRTEFLPDVVQPIVILAILDHSLRPTSLSNVPPHFLFQIVSDPVTTTERITLVQCIQRSWDIGCTWEVCAGQEILCCHLG